MGQCCSAPRNVGVIQATEGDADKQASSAQQRGLVVSAPGNAQSAAPHQTSPGISGVSPGSGKRRRAVAASPTKFFELLAEPSAKTRTELLQRATIEYQSQTDLAPFAPDSPQHSILSSLKVDSPQNSVKSRLNALFAKPPPTEDATLLQDMCGETWIPRNSLYNWRPLGSGAFAVVQLCMLKPEQGPAVNVAVKKLKPHVLSNTSDLREFLAEANILRRLKHRHIVEFKGVGCMEPQSPETMASTLFIVQEFMAGNTLKVHVLHQMFPSDSSAVEAPYTWRDALRWLQQIAGALRYLHDMRPMVVHRDLKLENLLLTGNNPARADAKLADFGLCKLIKDTAIAVPFVPSAPSSNPQSQRAHSPPRSPAVQQSNTQQVLSTRPTDGQAVGSTPQAPWTGPQQADDSARPTCSQASTAADNTPVVAAPLGQQSVHSFAGDTGAEAGAAMSSHAHSSRQDTQGANGSPADDSCQWQQHADLPLASPEKQQPSSSAFAHTAAQQQAVAAAAETGAGNAVYAKRGISTALSISARGGTPTAQGFSPHSSPPAQGPTLLAQGVNSPASPPMPMANPPGQSLRSSEQAGHMSREAGSSHEQQGEGPSDAAEGMQASTSSASAEKAGVRLALAANSAACQPSTAAGEGASGTSGADNGKGAQSALQARAQGAKAEEGLIAAFMGTPAEAGPGQGQNSSAAAAAAAAGGAGPAEEGEVLYNMTGQTGSLMYMAPEVMKGQSYNEKVDVFSFAIIIFELLSFRVAMAAIGDHRDLDYEAVHAHAEEVSHGYRLPLPARWPFPIQALIRDCWNHKSSLRPSFAVIEQRLQEIQASGVIDEYLALYPSKSMKGASRQSSCIIS